MADLKKNINQDEIIWSSIKLKLKDARKLFDTFRLFGGSKEDWLRTIHDHCEKMVIDYFSEFATEEETYRDKNAVEHIFCNIWAPRETWCVP